MKGRPTSMRPGPGGQAGLVAQIWPKGPLMRPALSGTIILEVCLEHCLFFSFFYGTFFFFFSDERDPLMTMMITCQSSNKRFVQEICLIFLLQWSSNKRFVPPSALRLPPPAFVYIWEYY